MGKQTTGIYQVANGSWEIDKWVDGVRLREFFRTYQEAEAWLTRRLEERRVEKVQGRKPTKTFNEAAGRYLHDFVHLPSIESSMHHLKAVMPFIGHLTLEQIHDGTLRPFVAARQADGRSHKTINLSLAVVRRVLNLSARSWRDEQTGLPWLASPPLITMLPLLGHQREPRPISWEEQGRLMKALPDHLQQMALFALNTGVRDDVICTLRWEWEIPVTELGISVFEVPRAFVKGKRQSRVVICNTVAQQVVESARNKHPTHVFVMSGHGHELGPIQTMNNTAWQRARKEAKLGDLHVHDLRHTAGMRLREAGALQNTISDVLWHTNGSITAHYSISQIKELHDALEQITAPSGGWNKTLQTLRMERDQRQARST